MIEVFYKIAPDDDLPRARRKRRIEGWSDLDGITCKIRVGIQPASGQYPERNVVLGIINEVDEPPRLDPTRRWEWFIDHPEDDPNNG